MFRSLKLSANPRPGKPVLALAALLLGFNLAACSSDPPPDMNTVKKLVAEDRQFDALKVLIPLAQDGDPQAQYELAGFYHYGYVGANDYAKALKWYRASARQGYADSMVGLSVMYLGGQGVAKDRREAFVWLNLAAQYMSDKQALAKVKAVRDEIGRTLTKDDIAFAKAESLLLQPETARSWEAGVNLKYNDVFTADDSLRAKVNLFHTDVENYIDVDLTTTPRTAINIGDARLKGVEAEAVYDYGWGFVNLSGALIDAKIVSGVYEGQALNNTPLDRFAATIGFRALEDKLTFGAQYLAVGKITRTNRLRPDDPPVDDDGFDLVNVFANWQINDHTRLDFGVDNVFNKAYTDPQSAWSTTAATEEGKGRTFKIALTGRIGG